MKVPACAEDYIKQILKKLRFRRKVRRDVQEELTAHFADELKDCRTDEDREQKAKQLIAGFGDGPFVYRKTESGFLLYSFGMDLKDDSGKLGLSSRGTPRMWADNGDWVFWPMAKPQ